MALTKISYSMVDDAPANVLDFGAVGNGMANDTAAFKAAIASGASRIYIPAGTYLTDFTNPTYRTDGILNIPSGMTFEGEGENSILRPYTNQASLSGTDAYGCLGTDSGSVSVWSEGLTFRDIKFYGWSETTPNVNQHASLLALSSVKRVLVERCYFVAPRGDGITISTGYGAGPANQRYNYDITIRDCVFDGVNNNNRNGISVIDCDGLTIEGCTFRNFSDPTMPGSIDLEPNESYSVIKNIIISNNKFSNTLGTSGHISFATDNIPPANQQNWVVSGNEFTGATGTSGAAIYILTEKTTPSVPNTDGQNIVITNNTATNCKWFVDHYKGAINGITIANNVVNFAGSSQGSVRMADGTADYTVTDVIITGNSFICNTNIALGITMNIVNLAISNNIFRGATQSHMRLGQSGSSTTNVSIINNQFIGTPSAYLCQHDASTHNPATNVWRGNYAPPSVPNNFRVLNTDVTGIVQNVFTTATLPSDFPYGESVAYTNSVNVGVATLAGITKTYKHSSLNSTNIHQVFWPIYDATYGNDVYFRKAVDASTWSSWYNIVGV